MAGLVLTLGSAIEPAAPIVLPPEGTEPPSTSAMTCFEAPLASPYVREPGGLARLCQADRTLYVAIRAAGLVPGEVYIAWLGDAHDLAACAGPSCGSTDLSHERSTGLMQQVIGEPGPLTRALAFDASIRDLRLAPGAEVTLLLLRAGGQTESQATFTIRYSPTVSVSARQPPPS